MAFWNQTQAAGIQWKEGRNDHHEDASGFGYAISIIDIR
jgi:hypothetical protein